jgi:alpha-L-arabinofuranosidase
MKTKKILSFIMSLAVIFSCGNITAYAKGDTTLNISYSNIGHNVSDTLYGISLEDASYAGDGGLVSNLVCNNSFEYTAKPDYAWEFGNVSPVLSTSEPINSNNPSYQTLTVDGKGIIKNLGFTELYDYKTYKYSDKGATSADMGFEEGVSYDFSCYVKNVDFNGTISVYLDSKNNSSNVVQLSTSNISTKSWSKLSTTLKSSATEDGALAIEFDGTGSISIDFVSLVPKTAHGYGTEEWKYVTLREDLFEAIQNLNPSFIKFPGGCLAEGDELSNIYSWKNTIGELVSRQQFKNHYANDDNGNYYNNTNSMGYHEYFQLCEDVGAIAIPVVSAGITCQSNNDYDTYLNAYKKISMSDDEWKSYLVNSLGYDENDSEGISSYTDYITSLGINSQTDFEKYLDTIALRPDTDDFNNYAQDILDLIEYANGDSNATYWGALRSANGHSEPFNVKYIQIGSDNWGDVYNRNFDALKKIINEKYPDIVVIASTDSNYESDITENYSDIIIDEHYNVSDDDMIANNDRYDSYDRDGLPVIVSEYSAVPSGFGTMITKNNIWSAVVEAGFMTGFERNSDIVTMSSYATTLAKLNANSNDENMIWFDSQDIVLTPNYYTQMLFSNNVGTKYIDTELSNDSINQSVTVDEDKQVVYIKLVNSGTAQNITVNLDGFDDVNYVSNQTISNGYKSASNELDKQRVAPEDVEIDIESNSFTVSAKANSVNVIRVAYGDNTGDSLYQLPDNISYDTKNYFPVGTKILLVCVIASIPLGAVIGYMLYVKVISKKKKGRKND